MAGNTFSFVGIRKPFVGVDFSLFERMVFIMNAPGDDIDFLPDSEQTNFMWLHI
ncbi:MAG: hypothetical protein LBR68_01280 [Lachnoclostridium sp.]|jgi:hypothetical protein|nr:hypothetical protein [Lachnoclostridium sp.]